MTTRSLITSAAISFLTFTAFNAAAGPKATKGAVLSTGVPNVVVASKEPYKTKSGTAYTIYKLAVSNLAQYPAELFTPATKLPPNPCRGNEPIRFLWTIKTTGGEVLSCGTVKKSPDFRAAARVLQGGPAPEVRLVLTDSKTGTTYTSAAFRLQ